MKKIKLFLLSMLAIPALFACGGGSSDETSNGPSTTDEMPSVNKPDLVETDEDVGFAFHYNRTDVKDGKFKYNLWLWAESKDGADYQFNEIDDYGLVARYTWKDFGTSVDKLGTMGFIVKENKVWADNPTKDIDSDRFVDLNLLDRDQYGYYHVYLKNGDANIYISEKGDLYEVIQAFEFAYNRVSGFSLWFQTNKAFSAYKIKYNDEVMFSSDVEDDRLANRAEKQVIYNLGTDLPEILGDYRLEVTFKDSGKTLTRVAAKQALYSTAKFDELYTYNGELGAIYSASETTFRVWSPVSSTIKLRIYNNGTPKSLGGDDTYQEYEMVSGEKGTWSVTVSGDLHGKYYTYVVTNPNYQNMEIVDPYAKSTGINGLRGMIVDFSRVNPNGWDQVELHDYKSTELTVYETHIADLTSSKTWGGTAANAKLYKGFYEAGTTYTEGDVTVSTGFDHIKELGVNAVQILPIFDQANDERPNVRKFNWGYNPLNYNALDGIYSADPYDGLAKIKEFKGLVKAYNEAGINIIMDVVYNHVNGLDRSNFDVLMPGYYYRYSSGKPSNGSGCGNETASEMPMFRKFMIESTEFWASEYKLGGFRFDLMGIHDIETMNQLAKNLHDNVSSSITVYGEPWAGGTIALKDGTPANQVNMNKFDGYGCFNDKLRDALIKGGLNSDSAKGWITNEKTVSKGDINDIKAGIIGLVLSTNSTVEPEKAVNYVTCHDNYTLYDRIKAAGIKDEETIKKMAMLANSVVFTTQGITFMLAGEEFLRTKGGNSNSYEASYAVNELNYSLKIKNIDMFENYKKLIALKHNTALFGLSGEDSKKIEIKTNSDGSMIYYDLLDSVNNVSYRIVHSNGVSAEDKVVDLSGYELYLDTLNLEGFTLSANTKVQNYQTIIAYKNL
ncbi:MAG: type I pullulanase [Erysipelotrichales bacterium]|nr:type I pullulanase [Erysipelotrichales bacterium]